MESERVPASGAVSQPTPVPTAKLAFGDYTDMTVQQFAKFMTEPTLEQIMEYWEFYGAYILRFGFPYASCQEKLNQEPFVLIGYGQHFGHFLLGVAIDDFLRDLGQVALLHQFGNSLTLEKCLNGTDAVA